MFDMTLFSPRGMMIGFRGHTSTQGFEQVLQNRDMTSEVAASQATGFGEIIKGPKWPKLWSTVNTRWRPPSFVCLLKKYRNYSTYTVPTIVYHKANSEILCRDARTNSRRFWSIPNEDAPVIPSPWGKSLWRTAPAKNPPSRAMVPFANHLSSKPATRQRRLGWLGWFGWLGSPPFFKFSKGSTLVSVILYQKWANCMNPANSMKPKGWLTLVDTATATLQVEGKLIVLCSCWAAETAVPEGSHTALCNAPNHCILHRSTLLSARRPGGQRYATKACTSRQVAHDHGGR